MKNIGKIRVGEFKLDGKVDITDPGYDKDTWCRMTTDCVPGEYACYVEITDEGLWGKRVASIAIYLNDEECETYDPIGEIGVDAGLAGFFNNKPDYTHDEWLEICDLAFGEKYCLLPYGVFSESGFGDGGYDVYSNSDRSAFKIVFIEPKDDEEED